MQIMKARKVARHARIRARARMLVRRAARLHARGVRHTRRARRLMRLVRGRI